MHNRHMRADGRPSTWVSRSKDSNGMDTEKRSQMGDTRVMTQKNPGLHQNSGKRREIKISENERSSATDLQHTPHCILIGRPLDNDRDQALLIKVMNDEGQGGRVEALVGTAASGMHKHTCLSPRNP